MKIYIIFTGGTIGSKMNKDGCIAPMKSFPYKLLELYNKKYNNKHVEFIVEEPYCILSENLQAEHIRKLIQCVNHAIQVGGVDGIIITHGTDTLQYSAAMLGYIFGNMSIPILFVSSDYTLDNERSNGLLNFRYALEFIQHQYGNGVFVCYCNKGGVPVIHRGTRIQQHLPFSADVISVADSWYGRFEEGKYIQNSKYIIGYGLDNMFDRIEDVKLIDFSNTIMRIVPYVGMTYPRITKEIKAIIHESFHSGTIAIHDNLIKFASDAQSLGVPIFLSGLSKREAEYETVKYYKKIGIQPLSESAPIAQYCKLWLAVSNGKDLNRIMNISVAEDFIYSV